MSGRRIAIVGGGAAGFFLAVCLKEKNPSLDVTIFESGSKVLRKVKVSGGGRCNCTNTFAGVTDLSQVYPRGHRLMKRLMKTFSQTDAYEWWERHGVRLTVQDDGCVFPKSQNSQEIIDCLLSFASRYGVRLRLNSRIESLEQLSGYDCICIATGGMTKQLQSLLSAVGTEPAVLTAIDTEPPVPSLFTFSIPDDALHALTGTVAEVSVRIPSTKFCAEGPLLITHWGMSGPAILRLSSYAARHLADCAYCSQLSVNWLRMNEEQVRALLADYSARFSQKLVLSVHPAQLNKRLWAYLVGKVLPEGGALRWLDLSKKDRNRLVEVLCNDIHRISGRAPFKDEFVTCGGVSLSAVNPKTLESRQHPNLYFAGEILDIDGVTGGFNFQAAWTTAYTVAQSINT